MGCKFIREYLKVFAQNADQPRAHLPTTPMLGKAVGAWVVGCGYGCMPHLEYTAPAWVPVGVRRLRALVLLILILNPYPMVVFGISCQSAPTHQVGGARKTRFY